MQDAVRCGPNEVMTAVWWCARNISGFDALEREYQEEPRGHFAVFHLKAPRPIHKTTAEPANKRGEHKIYAVKRIGVLGL